MSAQYPSSYRSTISRLNNSVRTHAQSLELNDFIDETDEVNNQRLQKQREKMVEIYVNMKKVVSTTYSLIQNEAKNISKIMKTIV